MQVPFVEALRLFFEGGMLLQTTCSLTIQGER
jgi:hypothetical protein